jgi:hypothetical protein
LDIRIAHSDTCLQILEISNSSSFIQNIALKHLAIQQKELDSMTQPVSRELGGEKPIP